MSKARLVITAVVHEKRPVAEVAAVYGMHRSWIYRLLDQVLVDGYGEDEQLPVAAAGVRGRVRHLPTG